MKKILFAYSVICVVGLCAFLVKPFPNQNKSENIVSQIRPLEVQDSPTVERLYHQIGVEGELRFEAFEMALWGYENMDIANSSVIAIFVFSLPSTYERMYVIHLENTKLLYQTTVSYGRNSRQKYASSLPNRHGSYQSVLGI